MNKLIVIIAALISTSYICQAKDHDPISAPEPSVISLLAIGISAFGIYEYKKNKKI